MDGNKLKAKIIERGLSVEGLANLLKMDRSSLYRMLSNADRITIGKAVRIKEALNMTDEEATAIFFG